MNVEGSIVLVGACGMLGRECRDVFKNLGAQLVLCGLNQTTCDGDDVCTLDITNKQAVIDFMQTVRPSWVVNCAAYTAVDKAEQEPDVAMLVNATGAGYCAEAARISGASLVHISSDYVFGDNSLLKSQRRPFAEDEPICPCGVYGKSKANGEIAVREALPDRSLILRTSWLHGIYGYNFVDTMLRLGAEGRAISVVDDQIGSPTWAPWLASVIAKLVGNGGKGTFHACSRGGISWYDFAKEIFECAGLKVDLSRQSTAQSNRPAPRPAYSTLDVSKLEAELGEPCMSWKQCVKEHVIARLGSKVMSSKLEVACCG